MAQTHNIPEGETMTDTEYAIAMRVARERGRADGASAEYSDEFDCWRLCPNHLVRHIVRAIESWALEDYGIRIAVDSGCVDYVADAYLQAYDTATCNYKEES